MSVAEPADRWPYHGYRFPPEIIAHAVWLYFRFHLSFRDVQDLLAERGLIVSHETIRQWCTKFGATFATGLRRRRGRAGDKWHLDEVALKIRGKRHWLWRAVDQHGVVLDILVQDRRDQVAAERFLRRVLEGEDGAEPRVVITDKLASYPPAIRRVLPEAEHRRHKGLNNRAENSHLPTRKRERILQRFKSAEHAQRFLVPFSAVSNHFRPRRHRLTASAYRHFRTQAHTAWLDVTQAGACHLDTALRADSRRSTRPGLLIPNKLTTPTQESLAERAGLSMHGIQKLERGVNHPHRDTVQRLIAALQLSGTEEARFKTAGRPAPRRHAPHQSGPATARESTRHNLPVQSTPFIGRQREIRTLRDLLSRDDVRLVTLTGPSGGGKTRLGLQVVAELIDLFVDGVTFVDLAPIVDPTLVMAAIARNLGVEDAADRTHADLLVDFLRGQRRLLVLDNFEQVLAAATVLDYLLSACAGLVVLVTSRAPLQLRSEREFPVPSLALPDSARVLTPELLSEFEAVALFVERASAIRPDFALTDENAATVVEICTRLDGLPLAIELAAARIRLLSPQAMLPRLGHALTLLTGGRRDLPARQQTLRSAIDWSYDLLIGAEQRLFRRLSVFVGGFTLESATAMCDSGSEKAVAFDVLASLVDNNLVHIAGLVAGEQRYGMLETIREYAAERLVTCGETSDARSRHLAWYLALAERIAPQAGGNVEVLERFDAELDNFRAALRWSEGEARDPELGLRLAASVGAHCTVRGLVTEGRGWFRRLLARSTRPTAGRAGALDRAGYLAARQNEFAAAEPLFREALEIWRKLDDKRGIAMTLYHFALVPHHQGDHDSAKAMLEESMSLARVAEDIDTVVVALRHLADLALDRGDLAEATRTYQETLSLARQSNNAHEIAYSLRGIGDVARAHGDYAQARQLLCDSLRLLAELRDRRCVPLCLEGLACIAVGPDWAERAIRLLGAAYAFQQISGAPPSPSELADYRRTEADARAHLGEERFADTWAVGANMSFDEAVEYALAEDEPAGTATAFRASIQFEPSIADHGDVPAHVHLSAREREVVALIAGGLSNREIAERLVLSVRTVERHIENVYNRLGIQGKLGGRS